MSKILGGLKPQSYTVWVIVFMSLWRKYFQPSKPMSCVYTLLCNVYMYIIVKSTSLPAGFTAQKSSKKNESQLLQLCKYAKNSLLRFVSFQTFGFKSYFLNKSFALPAEPSDSCSQTFSQTLNWPKLDHRPLFFKNLSQWSDKSFAFRC